jgi:hypothetical protein
MGEASVVGVSGEAKCGTRCPNGGTPVWEHYHKRKRMWKRYTNRFAPPNDTTTLEHTMIVAASLLLTVGYAGASKSRPTSSSTGSAST